MRSGIKAIAALVLLSGCGSDANGADNQNNTAQNAPAAPAGAANDPFTPTMNLAPLPPGYVRLNAEEVARLIKGKTIQFFGPSLVISWSFATSDTTVVISQSGGIVPRQTVGAYVLAEDGKVCVPNFRAGRECAFIAVNSRKSTYLGNFSRDYKSSRWPWTNIKLYTNR